MKLLSEEIIKIRKIHKLTQQEFADRIYVTRQAVSKWECDKAFPSQDVINKIKEEFNVDLNELISDEQIKTAVVVNNGDIKKLKLTNKIIISSVILIGIIIGILSVIFYDSKMVNQIDVKLDLETKYVEWSSVEGARLYGIYVDYKHVDNVDVNRYNLNKVNVQGEIGSYHTLKIEAYTNVTTELIGESQIIEFKKNREIIYENIFDIAKNNYYSDYSDTEVFFETKLVGLFKINVYLDNSNVPYGDLDVILRKDKSDLGNIYKYNNEYYFHIDQSELIDYKEGDNDYYALSYNYHFSVKIINNDETLYKPLKIEIIPEKIMFNEESKHTDKYMDTFKYAERMQYYDVFNSYHPIENTMYEIDSTFNLQGKCLKIIADDSRVYNLSVIIFDSNENIIYIYDPNIQHDFMISIPTEIGYLDKIYICINLECQILPNDVTFTIEID